MEVEPNTTSTTPNSSIKEKAENIINLLRERLDEHDRSRSQVQDKLDEVCNKLIAQLESMRDRINETLKEKYEKEDAKFQELLQKMVGVVNEMDDDEQKKVLTELMAKSRTALLVKQTYELKKPEKEKKKKNPGNRAYRFFNPYMGDEDDGLRDNAAVIDQANIVFNKNNNKMDAESKEAGDDIPDLSNIYQLSITSEIAPECFYARRPEELKVVKASPGRVYLSFTKLFNAEEEKILVEHGAQSNVVYKVAIRKDGDDKWNKHDLTEENDEYFFSPKLQSGTTFVVKVRAEANKTKNEWSECVTFVPTFSESCGWSVCTEKNTHGDDAYLISEENPMVVTWNGDNYNVNGKIISNTSLPQNKISSWSIKLLKMQGVFNNKCHFGVTQLDDNDDNDDVNDLVKHYFFHNTKPSGWYLDLCCSVLGNIFGTRDGQVGIISYKSGATNYINLGDTVGVVMDTTKGELSFAVNGVNLGVAYEGIPLDKPLFPFVTLVSNGDSVELDISEVKEIMDSSIPIPSNIVAKSVTWDSITLTWDVVDGASFYQIKVDGNKFWDSSKVNTFTADKFVPDSDHSFRVRTVRGKSVSEWSDVVKIKTSIIPDFSKCVWKKPSSYTRKTRENFSIDENNPRILNSSSTYSGNSTYTRNDSNPPDMLKGVVGDIMLQPNKVTSWNINILSLQNSDGNFGRYRRGLHVGVSPLYKADGEESCGWYLDCLSFRLVSKSRYGVHKDIYGPKKADGKCVQAGDTVGVVMDTVNGELSFVIDGVNYGVAYKGIPLDKPLAPSVCLSCTGCSVELDPTEAKLNMVSNSILPPQNVVVQNRTWNSITFVWGADPSASYYQVEVNGELLEDNITDSNYSCCRLPLGTEVNFRVRSMFKNEMSEWSDVVTGKTEEEYPDLSECSWREDEEEVVAYKLGDVNKRIATQILPYKTSRVLGTTPFPLNKIASWSVKVLEYHIDENGITGVLAGISPYKIRDENKFRRFDDYEIFLNTSTLHLEYRPRRRYETYEREPIKKSMKSSREGDTVGLVMDTINGKLSFYLNGVNTGITVERIPLDKPLFPCVILEDEGDSVELDLSEVKEDVSASVLVPSNVESSATWNSITFTWDAVEGASFYQVIVDDNKRWKKVTENKLVMELLLPETEHNFKIRTVEGNSVSEWSDSVKVKTAEIPDFNECVWRETAGDTRLKNIYFVDKANPRIATSGGNFSYVIGSVPLPPNKITTWNVKVLKSSNGCISIGVVAFDEIDYVRGSNKHGWFINFYNPKDNEHRPFGIDENVYALVGDTVCLVMDTSKGELSFIADGVNNGIVHEGIPLDKPLVPCVIFRGADDSVELEPSTMTKENEVDCSIPVPSNGIVKESSCDSMTLMWDAVDGASFYQVEVDGTLLEKEKVCKNTFTKKNLFAESEHSFRIRTIKGTSVSEWSDVVNGRTQKAPEFNGCVWKKCPEYVNPRMKYSVDEKNPRIATCPPIFGFCTIIGNTHIPLGKVTSWNIKILKPRKNSGEDIFIGVAPFDIKQNEDSRSILYECGWYFDCYSSTLFSGPPHKYNHKEYGTRKEKGQYVHTGNSVGVVMDTVKSELSFVLNGVNLGVAFKRIPLDKPLVPCVLLLHEADSVELII